jgi:hypothetical protein
MFCDKCICTFNTLRYKCIGILIISANLYKIRFSSIFHHPKCHSCHINDNIFRIQTQNSLDGVLQDFEHLLLRTYYSELMLQTI